jgi:hypothetical protein
MVAYVRITGLIAAGLILAGCAARASQVRPSAERSAAVDDDRTCLSATRIRATGAKCSSYGRSYSNEDIMRTGAVTLGDALPLLDPSIAVHR